MKPGFALSLAHSGVTLLQRSPRGWLIVGEVALDDPALDSALEGLRTTALTLEPAGIATKLVIPRSELIYTKVDVPGPDPEARRQAVREHLEGMTPFPVDELVFDWSGSGKRLNVVVVARETLDEAEAFARHHRFNPVSFVAQPEPGQFIGEPFFGPTGMAETLIGAGAKVERDLIPIAVVGRAEKPVSQARPIFANKAPFAGTVTAEAPASGDTLSPADAPEATDDHGSEPKAAAHRSTHDPADNPPADAAQAGAVPDSRADSDTPVIANTAGQGDTGLRDVASESHGTHSGPPMPPTAGPEAAQHAASGPSEEPAAAEASEPEATATISGSGGNGATPEETVAQPQEPPAVFSSRRSPGDTAAAATPRQEPRFWRGETSAQDAGTDAAAHKPSDPGRPNGADRHAVPFPTAPIMAPGKPGKPTRMATGPAADTDLPGLAERARGGIERVGQTAREAVGAGRVAIAKAVSALGKRSAPHREDAAARLARNEAPAGPKPIDDTPDATGTPATSRPRKGKRNDAAKVFRQTPPTVTPAGGAPAPRTSQPLAADRSVSEAEAMTVFGARRREPERSGFARTGLVLVGVLVLVLGGVGIWAGYFLSDPAAPVGSTERAQADGIVAPEQLMPLAEGPATVDAAPAPVQEAAPGIPEDMGPGPQPPAAEVPPAVGTLDPMDALPAEPDPLEMAPFNVDEAIAEALQGAPTADDEAVAAGAGAAAPEAPLADTLDREVVSADPPAAAAAEDDLAALAERLLDATPPLEALTPEADAGAAAADPDVAPAPGTETPALSEEVALPAVEAPPAEPPQLTREEFEAAFEETGIWPFAPDVGAMPRPGALGDIRPAEADSRHDLAPPALPGDDGAGLRADAAPVAPAPPAPFVATATESDTAVAVAAEPALPEGAISVITGPPPLQPPLRRTVAPRLQLIEGGQPVPEGAAPLPRPTDLLPAGEDGAALSPAPPAPVESMPDEQATRLAEAEAETAAPEPAAGADPAEIAEADTTAMVPIVATVSVDVRNASLVADALRPAPRPADAAPQAPPVASAEAATPQDDSGAEPVAAQSDTAEPAEAPSGGIALAALRPQTRPEALASAAAERIEAAEAEIAAQSALAVARSPVPGARPDSIAQLAARAQQQQQQTAAAAPAPAAPAAAQPVAVAPAASATPAIPTRATVAQQATQTGAINLRQINLIGVFGTSSDRRALVRMPNGQVVSVRVGDRLDGGQVAAIGDSELRYVKNGRNTVLRVGEG
jgi:hypothetical protein